MDNTEGYRKIINDWVARQTRGRIRELLPAGSIDTDSRLVLTNTIYFNGKWNRSFDKNLTIEDDFRTAGGKKIKASFMLQQARLRYGEDDAVQVLEIPYGNDQLCIRAFLPRLSNGFGAL